jgi:hypothetical protein
LLRPIIDGLGSGEFFIEKTPSHALYIPEIKQLFPDSKIINMIRDPRAVVASLLAAARSWGADWAPSDPGLAASMWVQHVQAVRESAKTLASSEFCEVRYEELWQSPKEILRDLAKFLGLSWNDHSISEAVLSNRPEVIETRGTPIPMYGEAATQLGAIAKLPQDFVRKARPDSWKGDLSLVDKRTVWRVVRRTMKDSGYSWRFSDWL